MTLHANCVGSLGDGKTSLTNSDFIFISNVFLAQYYYAVFRTSLKIATIELTLENDPKLLSTKTYAFTIRRSSHAFTHASSSNSKQMAPFRREFPSKLNTRSANRWRKAVTETLLIA